MVGYFNRYGMPEGVCFKLKVDANKFDKFEEELEIKIPERGFYSQNRL